MATRRDRFRQMTVATRLPAILHVAMPVANRAGRDFPLRSIMDVINSDAPVELDQFPPEWSIWAQQLIGRRPSELSFLDFEYWFYGRILDVSDYYQSGLDPFGAIKQADMAFHLTQAEATFQNTRSFAAAAQLSLAGNAQDRSQVADRLGDYMVGAGIERVGSVHRTALNIICDNFGGEFISDLVLALRYIEEFGSPARLHVKDVPLFVSDTTSCDAEYFLQKLGSGVCDLGDGSFGRRVLDCMDSGTLSIQSHGFWSTPALLSDIPDGLGISSGDLTVLKGDLNYRRALGDVDCPIDTPFEDLADRPRYPMLSLRSVKSHCLAGVDLGEWPSEMDSTDFPMDGSVFLAQWLPSASA